jgi:hypothetical protein
MKFICLLRLFCLSLFFLFFSSCKDDTFKKGIDILFSEVDSLEYSQVLCKDFIWGQPLDILCPDSVIIIYDEKNYLNLFHLVDLEDPDRVLSFGRKGQGVNEFIMPSDFQIIDKKTISTFDFMKKNLYKINLSIVRESNLEYDYSILVKDTLWGTTKILPTIYNSFVKLGFYDDCMLRLNYGEMQPEKLYGEYPYKDTDEEKIENRMRGMAYQGNIRLNPGRDKFVFAVNRADIIYFYKVLQEDIILTKYYELSYPMYLPNKDGESRSVSIAANNNRTFISISTSDDYVYTLYSGKNMQENGMKSLEGDIIYVFDWEGNPIKKYNLNCPVTHICVNNDNSELYAFSNMPDPQLIKFELMKNALCISPAYSTEHE